MRQRSLIEYFPKIQLKRKKILYRSTFSSKSQGKTLLDLKIFFQQKTHCFLIEGKEISEINFNVRLIESRYPF